MGSSAQRFMGGRGNKIPIKKMVSRGGKSFQQTFYVSPKEAAALQKTPKKAEVAQQATKKRDAEHTETLAKLSEKPKRLHITPEIQDDWVDWSSGLLEAGDGEKVYDLEKAGYKYQFITKTLPSSGEIKKDHKVLEGFKHGHVIVSKKMLHPKVLMKYGISPVGGETRAKASSQRILDHFGDKPIELRDPRYGGVAFIHPATRPGVEWQGSRFDEYGPVGHIEGKTKEEVLHELIKEYDYTEIDEGGVERAMMQAMRNKEITEHHRGFLHTALDVLREMKGEKKDG